MQLSGRQAKRFAEVLGKAFPAWDKLAQMTFYYLDQDLAAIAPGDHTDLDTVIFHLIRWASAGGRMEDLLTAACAANPNNPDLQAFVQEVQTRSDPTASHQAAVVGSSYPQSIEVHVRRVEVSCPSADISAWPDATVSWRFVVGLYVMVSSYQQLALPWHQCNFGWEIPGCLAPMEFEHWTFEPPEHIFGRDEQAAWWQRESLTITSRSADVLIHGPGPLYFVGHHAPGPAPRADWRDIPAQFTLNLLPAGAAQPLAVTVPLTYRQPPGYSTGKWLLMKTQVITYRPLG